MIFSDIDNMSVKTLGSSRRWFPMPNESTSLRPRREAVVREHMESENGQDFERTLKTFAHPRYELIGGGEVYNSGR